MRHAVLVGAGVMLFTISACAQYRAPYPRPYHGGPARSAGLIDRVLADLDRTRSYGFVDHHERKHFDQARKDLLRFRDHWYDGRFDKDRLDGAIANIDHLAYANQVHPRDRRILARDVEDLREFRAARGGYGAYGYRDRRW